MQCRLAIKNFGLNLEIYASKEHLVHCFKNEHPVQICFSEQLHMLKNADTLNSNPFITEPTNSYMEEANNENNVLDPNDYWDDLLNIGDI